MKVKVSVGSKSFHIEIGEGEGSVSTLRELKGLVAEKADIDPALMKIIHRGKTITGDNDQLLFDMNFKDNDRVIVLGKASVSLKDDLGFSSLVSYEKTNLSGLQKEHQDIESDLSALERNYLDVEKSMVMVGKMEKRLSHFTESSMRHLEALDRMDIIGELTTESQAVRNREKRKSLIDGVHTLMNGNDKHVRRLEEYKKKLLGEIVE